MNRRAQGKAVEMLAEFDFSTLEAGVYVFLLQEPSVTGYRVAQALNRPVANVYKALESLHAKGAVLVDETDKRHYRAVPPGELLGAMEHTFRQRRLAAERALKAVGRVELDDGVYQLADRDQVFARCREMIRGSREVILGDMFPRIVTEFAAELEAAAARDIPVAVQVYAPVTLSAVDTILADSPYILERWDGQWLEIVVDGIEMLVAYLDADARDVYFGLWSRNPYLTWTRQGAKAAELLVTEARAVVARLAPSAEAEAFERRFHRLVALGSTGYRAASRRSGRRPQSPG